MQGLINQFSQTSLNRCKAKGCQENHAQHYCRQCKNSDSDHRASNCPNNIQPSNKCKVQGCLFNHTAHYCKKCENADSDHFSSNCPQNVNNMNNQNQANNGIVNQYQFQPQGNNQPNYGPTPSNSNTTNVNKNSTVNTKFNVYKALPNFNNPFTNQLNPNSNQMSPMPILNNNQMNYGNQMDPNFQMANPAQIPSNNPMNYNNQIFKCKVKFCTISHQNHFCHWCNDPDSDHRASKCLYYDPTLDCKVPTCIERHQFHYCKNCKNQDSDHFATFCPFQQNQNFQKPGPIAAGRKCTVAGCRRNHKDHYCRFCEDRNSNHFAKDCPQTVELCHATKLQNLEQQQGIGKIGLQPGSAQCRFGQGIYFAEYRFAKEIMENLYKKEGVLLKCKVHLGRTMDYGNGTDPHGSWKQSYDSCRAIHPPWFGGVTSQGFTEYCIKNPRKCKVYSLTYKGREFRMCDYQKKNEILNELKRI